ncbi:MAG: XdhC family protein [Synergistetes bacterium]|nr:XdhC family protein [Synergistota bacterium]
MIELLHRMQEFWENRVAFAVATIVAAYGSGPRKPGTKMLVAIDGRTSGTIGGGTLEELVKRDALKVIEGGEAELKRYRLSANGEGCGGDVDVFIDPVKIKDRVVIFGGGHIGKYLSKMAFMVGFDVVVVDSRPEYATKDRFPDAKEIIVKDFYTAAKELKPDLSSYVVVNTFAHKFDEDVLRGLLGKEFAYIAMVASEQKRKTIYDHLMVNGYSEEELKKIHSPAGLPIGGRRPEEIALSIVSQIVSVKYAKA